MTGLEAVGGIGLGAEPLISRLGMAAAPAQPAATAPAGQASFSQLLSDGLRNVDAKVANANDLVRQFAIDDSVPLHKVTYALEEARLSVELAMQIRGRLVESYRELMNMQL